MAANRPSVYDNQFFNAGVPAAGFKLYTYDSGTTTPKATYTDQAGTIPNTNPITLDADGMCELWLGTGEYTLALYTGLIGSGGALVNTWDDVGGAAGAGDITTLRADLANASDATKGAGMVGYASSIGRKVSSKLADWVSVKDFGAIGDGVADDTAAIVSAIASFPNQGSPTWKSWCLVFPNGVYKTTSKITIKDQQFGRVIGCAATIIGNFNDTILQFGDISGTADNLWFHVEGLSVQQNNVGASAYAVRAFHNYSCTYRSCFFYGGQYAFTLDGNANLIDGCTFRKGITGNVLTAGANNNEANTFVGCSNELSSGYGYDFSVTDGVGGLTFVDGGYAEQNDLGAFRIKNTQKVSIRDLYFNLQNLAPGVVLDGTTGGSYAQPFVLVENCSILGDFTTSTPFIKELTANSINAQYRNNRVESGLVDLYGSAPRSFNLDRKRKTSTIVNGSSIINSDATGPSDGWTLSGAGNVGAVSANSPYVNGFACSISSANSYQYQQVKVPANALVRISAWANCSGETAVSELQIWSVGIGSMHVSASTTSTTPEKLEVYITPAMRASATAFVIMLRNTGAGDNAVFSDIEIEDITN